MPQTDRLHIDTTELTSFEAVLAELDRLDGQLRRQQFDQFIVFNKAYSVVTDAIKTAAEGGYFKNPKFIEAFSAAFAQYYFQAINDTVAGNPELPIAWAKVNQTADRKVPAFIPLLMGANAHINHDLPLTLLELMNGQKTDELLRDVLKIDKLLMGAGREIVKTFEEPNKRLDFLRRRLQFLYYRPIMYLILSWRIGAWRSYKVIKKNGRDASRYEKKSIKTADRLLKLGQLLS